MLWVWFDITEGDAVRITRKAGLPREADRLIGRAGKYAGLSKTHGYAIVYLTTGGERVLVHPENLERIGR